MGKKNKRGGQVIEMGKTQSQADREVSLKE